MASEICFGVEMRDDVMLIHLVEPKFQAANRSDNHLMFLTEIRGPLLKFIDTNKPRKLAVNFAHIDYCSSQGINLMLAVREHVLAHEGRLKLYGMAPLVREPYKIAKLDGKIFDICDTEDQVVEQYKRKRKD